MGTRADFFIGTGPAAEWIGSITWDGYPDGNPAPVFGATDEASFRRIVNDIITDPELTATKPDEGWPWPWDDSRTTDYAYAWVKECEHVIVNGTGHRCSCGFVDDQDGVAVHVRNGMKRGVVLSKFGRQWRSLEKHLEDLKSDAYNDEAKLSDDQVVNMAARRMSREELLAKSGLVIITR